MNKAIARLNIDHYRKILATKQDETERQRLIRLLADEEAKLAALDDPPRKNGAALSIAPAARANAWAIGRRFSRSRHDPTAEDVTAWKRDSVAHRNQ